MHTGASPARRPRGTAQNFANQIAQLVAGWEIGGDGPTFGLGPPEGDVEIDLVTRRSMRDGVQVELVIADHMFDWIAAERGRKRLSEDWVQSGKVRVHYARDDRLVHGRAGVIVRVSVDVVTQLGPAHAEFSNSQVLWNIPHQPK